jgi:5-methylcytosine-specific restriction endonuclease McrA
MNFKNFSNQQLHLHTISKVEQERLSTIEILWHLCENEKRMLFAEMGYRDLKEYCVKELKYSEGSAWRRISAMRLLNEVPEMEEKIHAGELNLTQFSLARSHFREVKSTILEKRELLMALENRSIKSTERFLAEQKPDQQIARSLEVEKPLRGQRLEVTLVLDEEMVKDLQEIEMLLGKPHSKLELFRLTTKQTLEHLRKKEKPKIKLDMNSGRRCKAQPLRSRIAATSRYVPAAVRRRVEIRDQHQCQYSDPVSGRQCQSRQYLQLEHIVPFAKGGRHDLGNLQLLCVNHNRLRAIQEFGSLKIARHINIKGTALDS